MEDGPRHLGPFPCGEPAPEPRAADAGMSHAHGAPQGDAHKLLVCGERARGSLSVADSWLRTEARVTVSVLSLPGLHVFPTFVVYELSVLMVLTLSVVIMKVRILLSAL